MTPTLLDLQVSMQTIEANQRNRQSVEAEQLRVTAEIKQTIEDVMSVPTSRDAPCAETKMANQHLMLFLSNMSFHM